MCIRWKVVMADPVKPPSVSFPASPGGLVIRILKTYGILGYEMI